MKLSELLNVLKTAETAEEMDVRREEIAALIPAVRTMFGYDQKNSAHQYDLWMHSLHVVCNLPRRMENDMVYLAALLHDIGKPEAQFRGKREGDPDMHYYVSGHLLRPPFGTQHALLRSSRKKHGNRARRRGPGAGPAGVCDSVFRCTGAPVLCEVS